MNISFFHISGIRAKEAETRNMKKEGGVGVRFTQGSDAASAALRRVLPWAIIMPPHPGLRRQWESQMGWVPVKRRLAALFYKLQGTLC